MFDSFASIGIFSFTLKSYLILFSAIAGKGSTIIKAVSVLVDSGVAEHNILLLSLFATPDSKLILIKLRISASTIGS